MIVGLIGGVASGKSFVGRKLADLVDGVVIDADVIAREVVQQPETLKALCNEFGKEILDRTGQLDRVALASMVFGVSQEAQQHRLQLNAIVHPEVRKRSLAKIAEVHATTPERWIIIDAPLLLEAGWGPSCDHIIFVDSTEDFRRQNGLRRGWDAGEIERREQSQMPLDEKRLAATHILLNSGNETDVIIGLQKWLEKIAVPLRKP